MSLRRERWSRLLERRVPLKAVAAALVAVALAGAGLTLTRTRAARGASVIGYVDQQRIFREFVQPTVEEPLRQEVQRLQAELDEKSREADEKKKQELFDQYQGMLERRQQEMVGALWPRVARAIEQVAREQDLEVVTERNFVLWGGRDVTAQVLLKLGVKTTGASGGGGS